MNAINLPLSPTQYELDPEDTVLEENEVRTMVDPNSNNDSKLQELQQVLIDWINDMLVGKRIIVKDLAEDLYDGQVLQKLFENLEGEKLNVAEVTQSEIAQKQQTVLETPSRSPPGASNGTTAQTGSNQNRKRSGRLRCTTE
uniref:Parvin, alpha a n=1 Tax=Oncorhynchus tshawytscha TaxID=74940 RepID=A0AAZ3Q1C4_ONCTS